MRTVTNNVIFAVALARTLFSDFLQIDDPSIVLTCQLGRSRKFVSGMSEKSESRLLPSKRPQLGRSPFHINTMYYNNVKEVIHIIMYLVFMWS